MSGPRVFFHGAVPLSLLAAIIGLTVMLLGKAKFTPEQMAQRQAMAESLSTLAPGDLVRYSDGKLFVVTFNPRPGEGDVCVFGMFRPLTVDTHGELCPAYNPPVIVIYRMSDPRWPDLIKELFHR